MRDCNCKQILHFFSLRIGKFPWYFSLQLWPIFVSSISVVQPPPIRKELSWVPPWNITFDSIINERCPHIVQAFYGCLVHSIYRVSVSVTEPLRVTTCADPEIFFQGGMFEGYLCFLVRGCGPRPIFNNFTMYD